MSNSRFAWADGLATIADDNTTLDAWFPKPALGRKGEGHTVAPELLAHEGRDAQRNVTVRAISVEIDLDATPADTADAYLRLHLLSHRLVRPRTINLDGIFGVLPIVAWTSAGPIAPEDLARLTKGGRFDIKK